MAKCVPIRRKRRVVCLGDMRDAITIFDRDIVAPAASSHAFTSALTGGVVVKAMVETVTGVEIFDGAEVRGIVSHQFYIRYMSSVNVQNFIVYDGQAYRVLDVQNYEQRNEFLILRCQQRGDSNLAVNTA